MAMYECRHCGGEYSSFPKVIILLNDFPEGHSSIEAYHNSKFENFFGTIEGENLTERWNKFFAELGDKESEWLCSIDCAIEYLLRIPEMKIGKEFNELINMVFSMHRELKAMPLTPGQNRILENFIDKAKEISYKSHVET